MNQKRFPSEKLLDRCLAGKVMAILSLKRTGAFSVQFAINAAPYKKGKNTCFFKSYFI